MLIHRIDKIIVDDLVIGLSFLNDFWVFLHSLRFLLVYRFSFFFKSADNSGFGFDFSDGRFNISHDEVLHKVSPHRVELVYVGALELGLCRKVIFEDVSVVSADSPDLAQALIRVER